MSKRQLSTGDDDLNFDNEELGDEYSGAKSVQDFEDGQGSPEEESSVPRPQVRRRTSEDESAPEVDEEAESESSILAQRSGSRVSSSSSSSSAKRRVRFDPSSFAEGEEMGAGAGRDDAIEEDDSGNDDGQGRYKDGNDDADDDFDGAGYYMVEEDDYDIDGGGDADSASQLLNDNDYLEDEDAAKRAEKEAAFLANFNKSAGASLVANFPDTTSTRASLLAALGKKIKKPSSSWILYTNSARELLPPSLSFKEKATLMSEDFKKLSTEERASLGKLVDNRCLRSGPLT